MSPWIELAAALVEFGAKVLSKADREHEIENRVARGRQAAQRKKRVAAKAGEPPHRP